MKKVAIFVSIFLISASFAFGQGQKFGHINLQETVYLMSEMDSALVILDKYSKELQDTYVSMQNEFQTKYNTYQQMNKNWTPAVLEAKEKELEDIQQRLQQFQQNAQNQLQQEQNKILGPIYQKANLAVQKVGRANQFIYIFDSGTGIPFINEDLSINVTDMVKKELNIPLTKKLPQNQAAKN